MLHTCLSTGSMLKIFKNKINKLTMADFLFHHTQDLNTVCCHHDNNHPSIYYLLLSRQTDGLTDRQFNDFREKSRTENSKNFEQVPVCIFSIDIRKLLVLKQNISVGLKLEQTTRLLLSCGYFRVEMFVHFCNRTEISWLNLNKSCA